MWQQKPEAVPDFANLKLQYVRDIPFHLPDSIKIGRIGQMAATQNPKLWAFEDQTRQNIIVTDNNGNYISRIGSYGSGPKEFTRIRGIAINEHEEMVVFDGSQLLFKVFDLSNSGLINTFAGLDETGYSQVSEHIVFSEDIIYMPVLDLNKYPARTWESTLMVSFTKDGEFIREFGRFSSALKDAKHFSHTPVIHYNKSGQSFYVGHLPIYVIQELSEKSGEVLNGFGELSKNFLIPSADIHPALPYNEIQEAVRSQSFVRNITSVEDFVLVHFFNPTERFHQTRDWNEMKHFVSVYDAKNHNLLAELSLPYQVIGFTENGILLIKDDNPDSYTLAEYKIIEDE